MKLVVDAGVAAKWIIPEQDTDAAEGLLVGNHDLIAPASLASELTHMLGKRIRGDVISEADARNGFARVLGLVSLRGFGGDETVRLAFDLVMQHQCSGYDATYVALALAEGCPFVTADRRLYNALTTALPATMLWVGDAAGEADS